MKINYWVSDSSLDYKTINETQSVELLRGILKMDNLESK